MFQSGGRGRPAHARLIDGAGGGLLEEVIGPAVGYLYSFDSSGGDISSGYFSVGPRRPHSSILASSHPPTRICPQSTLLVEVI